MDERARKPAGGFVFISATALIAAWWAYKRRFIDYRDLRVWLASHELLAKRCGSKKGRVPRFGPAELHHLVGGVGGEHVRQSLRRLESAGLLRFREMEIRFPHGSAEVRVGEPADLAESIESVTNHRRKVPVPRRLLRFLAGCSRPVLVATALGHLLRCMYYRNGECSPSGLCKASWIASVFEVDERNVKGARRELESLGVLCRSVVSQCRLNRWGVPMRFNLAWEGRDARRRLPPRSAQCTTEPPPPRETGNSSFRRSKNQKPGVPVPVGVRKRTVGYVVRTDLEDRSRVDALWRRAADAGLCTKSESDRLLVFGAASHALRVATRNAPGLFATVLNRRLWSFVSAEDEEQGRRLMRASGEPTRAVKLSHRLGATPERSLTHGEIRHLIEQSLRSTDAAVGEVFRTKGRGA